MAEKEKHEKASSEKMVLFNNSRNPFKLKDGRTFGIGESLEFTDAAEYEQLKKYRGVTTTKQFAPGLSAHIEQLEADKAAALSEVETLKKQLEKFQSKGR
jgi:hypothetical protein